MSGIAGVFHKNGAPVERGQVERLLQPLAFRGPDGGGVWTAGPVGLGLRAFWTLAEDRGVAAPVVHAATGAAIVMDGRLDNRAELAAELGVGGADAEIVLAAYARWGDGCAERLEGDYAIAIWDAGERRLFCLRDRFGVCPFYYAEGPDFFVFASELAAVLAHPAVGTGLNEGMLAELLANEIASGTETLYREVSRLAHRHCLTVTAGGARGRCYWEPTVAEARYGSEGECAEECLHLLREAVRRRMRAAAPVASHLSGGLDSSAVTALLAGEMNGEGLATYSNVFPGFDTDESRYIDLTARRYGVRSCRVAFQPPAPDYYREWTRRYRDFPGYPNGNALLDGLARQQRADGVRVVLGGQGGNQLFDGYPSVLEDDLTGLRLGAFWRDARGYTYGGGSVWGTAWRLGVRPLLPKPAWLRRALGRPGPSYFPLDAAFARRVNFGDRVERPWPWRPFGSRARRDVAQYLLSGGNAHLSEQVTRSAAHYGIEERVPFFDRRLAEFAIRLPEEYRQRAGLWKYILRRAVEGILPAEVAWRQVQAEFSGPAKAVVDSQELPELGVLAGYVDAEFLRSIGESGGARGLIHRPGMGVIRKWALLGVGYFLDER